MSAALAWDDLVETASARAEKHRIRCGLLLERVGSGWASAYQAMPLAFVPWIDHSGRIVGWALAVDRPSVRSTVAIYTECFALTGVPEDEDEAFAIVIGYRPAWSAT